MWTKYVFVFKSSTSVPFLLQKCASQKRWIDLWSFYNRTWFTSSFIWASVWLTLVRTVVRVSHHIHGFITFHTINRNTKSQPTWDNWLDDWGVKMTLKSLTGQCNLLEHTYCYMYKLVQLKRNKWLLKLYFSERLTSMFCVIYWEGFFFQPKNVTVDTL